MTYITVQEETKNWWKGLLQPSTLCLMAYIESLEHIEFSSFHFVYWLDELEVKGNFREYEFNICMEWGGKISLTFDSPVPKEVVSELQLLFRSYKYIGRRSEKVALDKFKKLAKSSN